MPIEKKKILYISQEITPYLAETAMSVLGRMTPQGIQEHGYEARTFMPKYGCINERRNQLHEVIRLSGMNIIIDDTDHPLIIKVATLQPARMQVYFIDSDDYFTTTPGTKELETQSTPEDNDERTIFFVRGVMETVKKLRWIPEIIHCSGWITALAPMYLKRVYNEDPSYREAKVVYSLHPEGFEGTLDARFQEKLLMEDVTKRDIKTLGTAPVDVLTLNKLALQYADALVQASADVPEELMEAARATGKPLFEYIEGEEEPARMQRLADFYASLPPVHKPRKR